MVDTGRQRQPLVLSEAKRLLLINCANSSVIIACKMSAYFRDHVIPNSLENIQPATAV